MMFDLTGMVGRGAQARRFTGVSFMGTVIPRPTLIGAWLGATVGVVVMVGLWGLIGSMGILVALVFTGLGAWVASAAKSVETSTTIYRYQQLAKQYRGNRQVGHFFLGTEQFNPLRNDLVVLLSSTRPVEATEVTGVDLAGLYGGGDVA